MFGMKAKYVRTEKDEIIVFCETILHKEFKSRKPVSAGFIKFIVGQDSLVRCKCYGESTSLEIKSNEEEDSFLADMQILGKST